MIFSSASAFAVSSTIVFLVIMYSFHLLMNSLMPGLRGWHHSRLRRHLLHGRYRVHNCRRTLQIRAQPFSLSAVEAGGPSSGGQRHAAKCRRRSGSVLGSGPETTAIMEVPEERPQRTPKERPCRFASTVTVSASKIGAAAATGPGYPSVGS